MEFATVFGISRSLSSPTEISTGDAFWEQEPRQALCHEMDLITFKAFLDRVWEMAPFYHCEQKDFLRGFTIGSGAISRSVERISETVVRKRPDIAFKGNQRISMQRLGPLIKELLVLLHPYLRQERNVVDLIAFEWETPLFSTVYDHTTVVYPSITIEYAEYGTLQQYLKDLPLSNSYGLRKKLCNDVGLGLEALHKCFVVHGDLKPDNVLVFSADTTLGVEAKLCDFSHSLFLSSLQIEDEEEILLPGGTPPWNAPEWMSKRIARHAFKSDVYSFGLLVWACFATSPQCADNSPNSYMKTHYLGQNPCERACGAIVDSISSLKTHMPHFKIKKDMQQGLADINGLKEALITTLNKTMRIDPEERDLEGALNALSDSHTTITRVPNQEEPVWLPMFNLPINQQALLSEPSRLRSFHPMTATGSTMVAQICVSTAKYVFERSDLYSFEERSDSAMFLFRSYIEGYGIQESNHDIQIALSWLGKAIEMENQITGNPAFWLGHVHYLFRSLGMQNCYVSDMQKLMIRYIGHALKFPVRDLRTIYEICDAYSIDTVVVTELQKRGIWDDIMGLPSVISLMSDFELLGRIQSTNLDTFTRNGDTLLHIAAASGELGLVKHLCRNISVPVNVKNRAGVNPLRLACRYGHASTVCWLVDQGGKWEELTGIDYPALAFLLNFQEAEYDRVCDALCIAGAKLDGKVWFYKGWISVLAWATFWDRVSLMQACEFSCGRFARQKYEHGTTNKVELVLAQNPPEEDCEEAARFAILFQSLEAFKLIQAHRTSAFQFSPKQEDWKVYFQLSVEFPRFLRIFSTYREIIPHASYVYLAQQTNISTEELYHLIFIAILTNDEDTVETLMQNPGFESILDRCRTPESEQYARRGVLELSVMYDRKRVFDTLIKFDVPVKQKQFNELFPSLLHTVAQYELLNGVHFAQVLLEKGEDVNVRANETHSWGTPLFIAIRHGNLVIVDILLEAGARMINPGCAPETALQELIDELSPASIPRMEFLFQHRKGPPPFKYGESSVLHIAAAPRIDDEDLWRNHQTLREVAKSILACVLAYFSDASYVNATDNEGRTPLHWACQKGCDWAVELLLAAGANPDVRDRFGKTPIGYSETTKQKIQKLFHRNIDDIDEAHAVFSPSGKTRCTKLLSKPGHGKLHSWVAKWHRS